MVCDPSRCLGSSVRREKPRFMSTFGCRESSSGVQVPSENRPKLDARGSRYHHCAQFCAQIPKMATRSPRNAVGAKKKIESLDFSDLSESGVGFEFRASLGNLENRLFIN